MKIFRRITVALVCLGLLLTLAACNTQPASSGAPAGSDPSSALPPQPQNLLELLKSDAETTALKNVVLQAQATAQIAMTGMTMDVSADMSLKALELDPAKPEDIALALTLDAQVVGQAISFRCWIVNGAAYLEDVNGLLLGSAGSKVKYDIPEDVMEALRNSEATAQQVTEEIPAELQPMVQEIRTLLEGITGTKQENKTVYDGTIRHELLQQITAWALSNVPEEAADEAAGEEVAALLAILENVTYGDLVFQVIADEQNRVVAVSFELPITVTEEGETYTIQLRANSTCAYDQADLTLDLPNLSEFHAALTDEDYETIYGMLFDEDGNLKENNETAYNLLCQQYGKETIDEIIEMMTFEDPLTDEDYEIIYGMLFDEDGHLKENNEEAYNQLCQQYGQDTIDLVIQMFLEMFAEVPDIA